LAHRTPLIAENTSTWQRHSFASRGGDFGRITVYTRFSDTSFGPGGVLSTQSDGACYY